MLFPWVRAVPSGRARAAGDALAVRVVPARGARRGDVGAAPVARQVPRFGRGERGATRLGDARRRRAGRGGPPVPRAQADLRRASAFVAGAPDFFIRTRRFDGRNLSRREEECSPTKKREQRGVALFAQKRASSEDAPFIARRGPHPSVRAQALRRRARGGRRVAVRVCRPPRLSAAFLRVSVAGAHQQQRAQRSVVPGALRQQSGFHDVAAERVCVRQKSRRRASVRARKRRRAVSGTRARHIARRVSARRRGARRKPRKRIEFRRG